MLHQSFLRWFEIHRVSRLDFTTRKLDSPAGPSGGELCRDLLRSAGAVFHEPVTNRLNCEKKHSRAEGGVR